jgi:hypothetical protein
LPGLPTTNKTPLRSGQRSWSHSRIFSPKSLVKKDINCLTDHPPKSAHPSKVIRIRYFPSLLWQARSANNERTFAPRSLLQEKVVDEISSELLDYDLAKVPNYFKDGKLCNELIPDYMKGFKVDLKNSTVSQQHYNVFIHECIVKPVGRKDFFTINNTPTR